MEYMKPGDLNIIIFEFVSLLDIGMLINGSLKFVSSRDFKGYDEKGSQYIQYLTTYF